MFENHQTDLHWIFTLSRHKSMYQDYQEWFSNTVNFKIPLENASRLLWTILSISKNDDDVLLSAVSRKAYYATAWFFFFSLSAKAHTPHALFSNSSSSHQKSSRRVSTGAVCWYRNSGAVAGSFSPCLPLPPRSGSSDVLSADFAVFHETYSSAGHQKGGQSYI